MMLAASIATTITIIAATTDNTVVRISSPRMLLHTVTYNRTQEDSVYKKALPSWGGLMVVVMFKVPVAGSLGLSVMAAVHVVHTSIS